MQGEGGKKHLRPYYTNAALDKCIIEKWKEQSRHEQRRTPATGKTRERGATAEREGGRDDEDGRKRIYWGCRGAQPDSFLID